MFLWLYDSKTEWWCIWTAIFLSLYSERLPTLGKVQGERGRPLQYGLRGGSLGFTRSTEVHVLLTRASFPIGSGTFIHGLTTDLPLCLFFGRESINGKKSNEKSSLQRNLRTSAALGPSVYLTSLIHLHGKNIVCIVKLIRRCTLCLPLTPFHHVCINKEFTVCKKH